MARGTNGTQVNVNRPDRGLPPWAIGAIIAAALLLLIGLFLLLSPRDDQPAVVPTPTPTATADVITATVAVEVTPTPEEATPTPEVVEVTPTPEPPSPTPVVIEVTPTPGEATPTPEAQATIAVPPTVTTAAAISPTPREMTAEEQQIMDTLRGTPQGDRITDVRLEGGNLEVSFNVAEPAGGTDEATTAREQVRSILASLRQTTATFSTLVLRGSAQGSEVIQLTYDANTVQTTDWASAPAEDIYGLATSRNLQPPYDTAP